MKNSTKAILAISAIGLAGAAYVLFKKSTQGLVAKSLEVGSLSESKSFTITLAEPFGICWSARVRDVATGAEFACALNTMTWTPSAPRVRPGVGNLYIQFEARNLSSSGSLTLTIKDDAGVTLRTGAVTIPANGYGSIDCTVDMPDRNYGITVSVTP